jgi:hypothetical protein
VWQLKFWDLLVSTEMNAEEMQPAFSQTQILLVGLAKNTSK